MIVFMVSNAVSLIYKYKQAVKPKSQGAKQEAFCDLGYLKYALINGCQYERIMYRNGL